MFSTLVESDARRGRRPGGTILSFLAHYALILGAIYASAEAKTLVEAPRPEKVVFVAEVVVKKPDPPPPERDVAPPPPRRNPVLIAPVVIPTQLPEIDLSQRPTDPGEFIANRPSRADSGGVPRSTGGTENVAYSPSPVEKPAMQAPNSATPGYPDVLRRAGVEGEALVSFVVDTTGRVEPGSFKVIRATHELFAAAVRSTLPRMRFFPAEIGDQKVRQLVQQPYSFAIVK